MRTSLSALQAQLDSAAPAVRVPVVSSPTGGVSGGMRDLSLEDQGAVLPGTPMVNLCGASPKVYFPVVVASLDDVCLAIIGQGLSFCLRSSCSIVSHQDARRFSFPAIPAILIRKAKDVAFCKPTLPYQRMDEELLANWKTNPRSLLHWSEAFSAFRRCLEALPPDAEVLVTDGMISAKREFHPQAQEVRTPSKVLFADMEAEAEAEGFEDGAFPLLSPFKPSVDLGSPNLLAKDKKLAKQVRMAEDSLSAVTHNLIHQQGALKDQDKIL
jgi:hypothetical protein